MGSDQDRVLGTNRGEKARCTVREREGEREREKEESKPAAESVAVAGAAVGGGAGAAELALGSTMDPMAVRNSGSE